MKYTQIKNELKKENEENLKYQIEKLEGDKSKETKKTKEEALKWAVRWDLNKRTSYAGTYEEQKEKCIKALKKKYANSLNEEIKKVEEIENTEEFKERLVITIEWNKSYMWGSNPRATDNYGLDSGSIGGCGYDKRSTATAKILNQHKNILKLLLNAKEKILRYHIKVPFLNEDKSIMGQSDLNRYCLTYGSGYGIVPQFEGGVGVSCHQRILEKVGLKMETITNAKSTDVYLIEVEK